MLLEPANSTYVKLELLQPLLQELGLPIDLSGEDLATAIAAIKAPPVTPDMPVPV
jgi:hypothetical protein